MKHLQLVWTLPLLAQAACVGHRYAVSGELASARNDNKWLVVHEPPAPPPVVVAPPVEPAPAALAAAATPANEAATSEAAFPLQDAATTPAEAEGAAPVEAAAVAAPATVEEPVVEPAPPEAPSPAAVAHERIDLSEETNPPIDDPDKPRLRRMVWGLSMRMGGTFASEDLIEAQYTDGSTETLTTGGGVNFFLGTTVIPFKYGSHSLGFGLEGGWKFSSIGQGSDTEISLSRNALMARVQYGYELSPAIHWIAAVGPQYETDITFKARGGFVGSAKFDNSLGFFGESGVLLDIGLFGLDLTLRHTRIDYGTPDNTSISANSWGIFCAVHIGLVKADNKSALNASN